MSGRGGIDRRAAGRGVHALDGAGAPCPLLRAADIVRAGKDADDGSAEARRRLSSTLDDYLRYAGRRFSLRRAALGLVLGLGWIGVSVLFLTLIRVPMGFRIPLVIGGMIAISVLGRRGVAREKWREIGASCVAEGFCGACAYSLRGLGPDGEGMVTCPECGARWRAAHITWGHWDHGDPWARVAPGAVRRFFQSRLSRGRRLMPDGAWRVVPVLEASLSELTDTARGTVGEARLRHAQRVVGAVGRRARWVTALACWAVAPVLALVLLGAGIGYDESRFIVVAVLVGVPFTIGGLVALGSGMYRTEKQRANALVALGLCPACATELRDGVPGPGGTVACTGCGSAWAAPPAAASTPSGA